jgi:hypothetical protein
MPCDKFAFCEVCIHNEDELVCDECDAGEGFERDESLNFDTHPVIRILEIA